MTNTQIKELVQLLPKRYQRLGFKIMVLDRKWKYLFNLNLIEYLTSPNNTLSTLLGPIKGSTLARIYYEVKKIYIYKFNFNIEPTTKLYMVFALYHELRHAYAYGTKPKYISCSKNEDDANEFARRMILRNFDDILKIINLDFNETYKTDIKYF